MVAASSPLENMTPAWGGTGTTDGEDAVFSESATLS
jgi:hypothetical protein